MRAFWSREHLEGGTYDAGNPIGFGHLEDVGRDCFPLSEAIAERFDCNIGADGIAIAKAVGDGLRWSCHLHFHSLDCVLLDASNERLSGCTDDAHGWCGDGRTVGRFVDHDPDRMGHLHRQAMVFEGRHKAHNRLRDSGNNGGYVRVAGGRVVGRNVDAASSANDLAAVHRPLEDDTRHTKRFKVTCSYEPVPPGSMSGS